MSYKQLSGFTSAIIGNADRQVALVNIRPVFEKFSRNETPPEAENFISVAINQLASIIQAIAAGHLPMLDSICFKAIHC